MVTMPLSFCALGAPLSGMSGAMRGGRLLVAIASSLAAGFVLVAAGPAASPLPAWSPALRVPGVVDVVGPRSDGRLVISSRKGLVLYRGGVSAAQPFATGPGGYTAAGGEPYVTIIPARRQPAGSACSFHRDDVFALDADDTPGVVRVEATGKAGRLADLPAGAFASGIAFDPTGRFGYRLLVTAVFGKTTTLYAVDCLGRQTTLVAGAPHVEGGIVVAPRTFGRFGGDLIAADEVSGRIYAFDPRGRVSVVAESGLPAGGDTGVEGLGFVPPGLGSGGAAYFSDLGAPQSPTKGTDHLLVIRGDALAGMRLAPGDLVAVTEGGAKTIAVHCSLRCTIRRVAAGPAVTHGEGHVTFLAD
jgi:hypothetical protein